MSRAVDRPMVWLASYPKSGSTWLRAVIAASMTGAGLTLAEMWPASQPYVLGRSLPALGLDPRWFGAREAEQIREAALLFEPDRGPVGIDLRKTHDFFHLRPPSWPKDGDAPCPYAWDSSRAVIHLVRDPRDVALSLAHYVSAPVEWAVGFMGRHAGAPTSQFELRSEQVWGSWSTHCESWMDGDVPVPVHRIRYEDLRRDAVGVVLPIMLSVGYDVSEDVVARAVESTSFERLQAQELDQGFGQSLPPQTTRFFRKGQAGAWREDLAEGLARRIESDHGAVMRRLGYEL